MKKIILILLAIINVACGESENLPSSTDDFQRSPKAQTILFEKTQGSDCSEFGYTDTLFFTTENEAGFDIFDDTNYIKLANITVTGSPYIIIYEFEDNPHSMWPTQSASMRVDYNNETNTMILSESCSYEFIEETF